MKMEIKKLQIELRDRRQTNTSLQREIDDMEKDISRLEGEKSKAQVRARTLENELRVARVQLDELLSTNLDNENVIRMKVKSFVMELTVGLTDSAASREHPAARRERIRYQLGLLSSGCRL